MNNKVFYQHPNLMRALGMHETVMEVMVNVLGGGGDSKVTKWNNIEKIFFSLVNVFVLKLEYFYNLIQLFLKGD